MDIAPTALELFGLRPPVHMDGRSLVDAADPFGTTSGKKPS
jgi:arylsulfatase A-like enzyme